MNIHLELLKNNSVSKPNTLKLSQIYPVYSPLRSVAHGTNERGYQEEDV